MNQPAPRPVLRVQRETELPYAPRSADEQSKVDEVLRELRAVEKDTSVAEVPHLRKYIMPHEAVTIPQPLQPYLSSVPPHTPAIMPYSISMGAVPATREQIKRGLRHPVTHAVRWLMEKCVYVLKMAHRHLRGRILKPVSV